MGHQQVVAGHGIRPPRFPQGHWMNRFWGPIVRGVILLVARVPIYRYVLRPEPEARRTLESGEPVIFSCVHQDVFDCCNGLPRVLPDRCFTAIVSYSRDGNLVATGLGSLGYEVVRGSSSRGGGEGLLMLRSSLRSGRSIVLASDGPTAPLGDIKPGVVLLAARTGAPILPVRAWGLCRASAHGSWSKATVSLPFGPVVVRVGDPIHVPAGCTEPRPYQLETARSIIRLSRWASQWTSGPPTAPFEVLSSPGTDASSEPTVS